MRVSVVVVVVVSSSSSTVDELVIEPLVFVVVVDVVVEVVFESVAVLSFIVLPELIVLSVVPLTLVEVPLARVLSVAGGFWTVLSQTGSVLVVVTVACSVLGVRVVELTSSARAAMLPWLAWSSAEAMFGSLAVSVVAQAPRARQRIVRAIRDLDFIVINLLTLWRDFKNRTHFTAEIARKRRRMHRMPVERSARRPAVLVTTGAILLLFGALLVLECRVALHQRRMAVDDAFIVFRYAENLGTGLGFRWNATGTPSEGFSSTVAVVAIAGLMRMGMDPILATIILNLVGAVILTTGLLAAAGLRTWAAPFTALPALYVVTDLNFAVHASRGLETAFFVAMAVLVILLAGHVARAAVPRTRGFVGLALASLFLGLCRPEAPLIVGACWLVAAIVLWRRSEPLREMVPGLGVLLAGAAVYEGWRIWYFGAPLPTPYYVKASLPSWLGVRETIAFAVEYRELLIPAALLSIACWLLLLRRSGAAATPPLEALVVMGILPPWLVYSARILHEVDYNHRFSYPLIAIAALGMITAMRFLLAMTVPRPNRAMRAGALVALLAGLIAVSPRIQVSRHGLRQPEPVDTYVSTFCNVGRAIGSLGLEDSITFVTPIAGAMPYYSRARHIDPFGLSSDELSRRRPAAERKRFLQNLRWDVTTAVVPPATPGATSAANDPLFRTPYFTKWLIPAGKWVALYDIFPDPSVDWPEYHHADMRKLRDTATLVGMIPPPIAIDPPRAWRHYLYVSRTSPHHDALVQALRGVVVAER